MGEYAGFVKKSGQNWRGGEVRTGVYEWICDWILLYLKNILKMISYFFFPISKNLSLDIKTYGFVRGFRTWQMRRYCRKYPGSLEYFIEKYEEQGEIYKAQGDYKKALLFFDLAECLRKI